MADRTPIEWTDATWNVVNGCSVVSPACTNCYAMRLAGTRFRDHPTRQGLTTDSKAGPVWNGQVRFVERIAHQPLSWTRPRRIFVCAHGDLFHESVPDEWIDRVFAVMSLSPQHVFQVLTKRSARMRAYLTADDLTERRSRALRALWRDGVKATRADRFIPWPLPNVWLGVSVEDQTRAEERIPDLLATPAAVRWISAEPLLGPIDLASNLGGTQWIGGQRGCRGTHRHGGRPGEVLHGVHHPNDPRHQHHHHDDRCGPGLDWVVAGGESGPGARPMHPDWARQLRDLCAATATPFLFKQWGDWAPAGPAYPDEIAGATPDQIDAWEQAVTEAPDNASGKVCCMARDGAFPVHYRYGGDVQPPPNSGSWWLERLGKKVAGRALDGRLHDAFPGGDL